MTALAHHQEALWIGALAVVPVAIVVGLMCRATCRPATRHGLWMLVLLTFIVPGVLVATGWSSAVASAVLGAPRALSWAFPPERAGEDQPPLGVQFASELEAPASIVPTSDTSLPAASPAPTSAATTPAFNTPAPLVIAAAPVRPRPAVHPSRDGTRDPRTAPPPRAEPREPRPQEPAAGAPSPRLAVATDPARAPSVPASLSAASAQPDHLTPHPAGPDQSERGTPGLFTRLLADAVGIDVTPAPAPAGRVARVEHADRSAPGLASTPEGPAADSAPRQHPPVALGRQAVPAITDPVWLGIVSTTEAMRSWASALADAAASIARIPAPPPALWVAGVLVIIALGGVRMLAGQSALRRIHPVDRTDRRLVEDLSEKLGLRHAPRAFLVKKRVSPMVCGGLNPRIILPEALWKSLDLDARRAVLTHELAHLRRRDQWVRLVEIAIGIAYWWHPVLWAVRRRIREEADLCCDAWVTTLFPGLRRSYAEALVRTRVYLSMPGAVAPVAGLGMASARSRRFSRRLTMVMTGQNRPRTSPLGVALALAVGTATLVVVPSLAHATLGKKGEDQVTRAATAPAPVAATGGACCSSEAAVASPVAGRADVLTSTASPVAAARAAAVYSTAPVAAGGAVTAADALRVYSAGSVSTTAAPAAYRQDGGLDERVRALEARIESLDARIQQLLLRLEGGSFAPSRNSTAAPTAVYRSLLSTPQFQVTSEDDGEASWHAYALPEGKLDALWTLMSRSDVPIYVSLGDGEISLEGTPAQQRVFAQFLAMIHPEGADEWTTGFFSEDARAEWTSGFFADEARAAQVEAELMARNQAMAGRMADLTAQERALATHQQALEAELAARMGQREHMVAEARRQAELRSVELQNEAQTLRARATEAQARARQLLNEARRAQSDEQREALEYEAEAMQEQAEEYRDAAEEMREHMQEAREELEESLAEMRADHDEARADLQAAMAEAREQLARARAEMVAARAAGQHGQAEGCACAAGSTTAECEDDCGECACCTDVATPAAPAAPASPARAASPARPATPAAPAAPAAPRPRRD